MIHAALITQNAERSCLLHRIYSYKHVFVERINDKIVPLELRVFY